MKNLKYIMMATICALFASCMGDRYAGTDENEPAPYGNNNLKEENVITIAELKDKFATVINTDYRNGVSYKQVTEDLKIKGVVTSSDVQGNIYNEIAIQDKTAAIIISVAQGGLYGYLPVGTEILVDLKDLYVGNYGLQAQIGVPSQSAKGSTSIGRISRATWEKHFKILSSGHAVEPQEFAVGSTPTTWDLRKECGKLGIIRNVTFKSSSKPVNGTFADASGSAGSIEWTLEEQDGRKVVVYNSNFADFANAKVPTGKVDIIGIVKRFNNKWEFIIRTLDDVKPAVKANPLEGLAGTGEGTQTSPFDVTRALSLINSGKADGVTEYYIKGIISQIDEVDETGKYGNATYYISDNGKTDNQLQVFRGYYLNGDHFTSRSQLAEGKKVLIVGKLKLYNNTNPEVDKGSKIITIN